MTGTSAAIEETVETENEEHGANSPQKEAGRRGRDAKHATASSAQARHTDGAGTRQGFDFTSAAQLCTFQRPALTFGDGEMPESLAATKSVRRTKKHRVPRDTREPWIAASQGEIERRVSAVENDLSVMKVDVNNLRQDSGVALRLQTLVLSAHGFTARRCHQ